MSATIYWEPVNPNPKHLHVLAPSWFMECLERADMALPNTFSEKDIPVLQGLAASVSSNDKNPFKQLIDAIKKNGEVNVWYQH